MLKFRCECGKKIGVPDEYEGRRVRCPQCGQAVVATREEAAPLSGSAPSPVPPPPGAAEPGGRAGGWKEEWDARLRALQEMLGPHDPTIATSLVPIYLGGGCDVLTFRRHVNGVVRVTAGLAGALAGQPPSALGNYELMMCTRGEEEWVPDMLSGLATYTLQKPINPNDTIDVGENQRPGVTLRALLALEPPTPSPARFDVLGRPCGLLLLVGITASELTAFRSGHADEVLVRLRRSVLPFTDLYRESVI